VPENKDDRQPQRRIATAEAVRHLAPLEDFLDLHERDFRFGVNGRSSELKGFEAELDTLLHNHHVSAT